MKRFTDPIRECIANGIWMPALTTALTLPDICSWLETPEEKCVGKRYKRWAAVWIEPLYTKGIGPDRTPHRFLSASDLYALRCAVAHNGSDDTTDQKAHQTLRKFNFCYPVNGNYIHCNQCDGQLQLQVDVFCNDICGAVDAWDAGLAENAEIQSQKAKLVVIGPTSAGLFG